MTRPCFRCGRSLGAATRVCRDCVSFVRRRWPEQWSQDVARQRAGLPHEARPWEGELLIAAESDDGERWQQIGRGHIHGFPEADRAWALWMNTTSLDSNAWNWTHAVLIGDNRGLVRQIATDALTMLDYLERDERERAGA